MELILLELQPTLSMPPPVTLHFFPLCVLKRCSPLHFERKPNLSKTLKGLLMRLVIFENNIFYVSGSKVNRKERSRPSLFFCSTLLNISSSRSIWFGRVGVLSGVWNGHRKSVWISMITGITTAPPIKVVVPLLDDYFILRNSRLSFFCNYVGFNSRKSNRRE